jgi:hypothetical protein
MTDFGEADVYASVHEPGIRDGILRNWAISELMEEGIVEDADTMERRVEARIGSLTHREVEGILSREAERRIADLIEETIRENFQQIRRDVQEIVERLLPDQGDPLDPLYGAG